MAAYLYPILQTKAGNYATLKTGIHIWNRSNAAEAKEILKPEKRYFGRTSSGNLPAPHSSPKRLKISSYYSIYSLKTAVIKRRPLYRRNHGRAGR